VVWSSIAPIINKHQNSAFFVLKISCLSLTAILYTKLLLS
jgi:hypothetical protein